MAIGGSHSNGSRGRSYGLMLLLAFGAAFFGVMLLHKLRERRIFTLLIKEKDHQLFSLHFLLQKEQEYSKEMKGKNEAMKAKMYSIRTQKMELDRRLIEMQSTIDSLKDDQKAMESALEKKQNEIKMQREVTDLGKENSQLTDLKESLMQKEAEIVDLKRRLEYPVKVWSVSTDDPLNPPLNLTNTLTMVDRDKTDVSSSKEENGWLHMSTNSMTDENSTRVEDRNEKREADTNGREGIVEQIQKLGNTQDGDFKNGSVVEGKGRDGGQAKGNDSQEQDGFAMGERKNVANSTEQTVGDFLKLRDDVNDENGHTTLGKPENFQDEKQDVRTISEGGMALERLDSSRFQARSRLRRHGRLTRTKGKRFRILAKNGGVASMKNRRFYRESIASNEGVDEGEGRKTGENPPKERMAVNSTQVSNLDDSGYLKNTDVNTDPNQQAEQSDETLKPDTDMIGNKNTNGEVTDNIDEVRQSAEEASGTQQNMGSRDIDEQENEAIQVKDGNMEDMELADEKERETEATDDDSLRESASNLEEDKEEYREKTNESEF